MWLIYHICHNYAFSLVIFTLITKIIMFPLSVKTQKSSAAMQAMQPKLEKLKKQYGNNQEKYNEETMKLYAEEGINPMASCWPMLIQFPVLYGIFDVVYRPLTHILRISSTILDEAKEIYKTLDCFANAKYFNSRPEIYIVQAVKDPAYADNFKGLADGFYDKVLEFTEHNTLFGADLTLTPTIHPDAWTATAVILVIIPVLSGLFQLIMSVYNQIRQKRTNPGANASMAGMNMMLYIMPIFSVWIAFSYPAAIGFYWASSSFFSLVQQIVLNKVYTPEYVQKLIEKDKLKKKNKKKQGMMERYQQLLAEQQAAQNGGKPRQDVSAGKIKSYDDDDDNTEVKLSKSKQKEYERALIREARRRQAEKYGEEYDDSDDED
jgi:YidC/Oxa1 family membrane protein insertase